MIRKPIAHFHLLLILVIVLLSAMNVASAAKAAEPQFVRLDTEAGIILLAMFPDLAPNHVANFTHLARTGFYEGIIFHRIVPNFVIQGGDPNSKDQNPKNDGMGGPSLWDVLTPAEIAEGESGLEARGFTMIGDQVGLKEEFSSTAKHLRGTLSMARGQEVDSGGSQFFICVDTLPQLDGKYTIYGHVVMGLGVVDFICGAKKNSRNGRDYPASPVHINKATVIDGIANLTEDEQRALGTLSPDLKKLVGEDNQVATQKTGKPGLVSTAFKMPAYPADLSVESVEFIEPSGNKALDGHETGEIRLVIENRGRGEAQNLQVALSQLSGAPGLQYEKIHIIERVESKDQHSLSIPITAGEQVQTADQQIRIQFNEEFGFDADPVVLKFETVAYEPPDLQVPKVAINDQEEGDAYGNGNSIIEPNESVIVTAFVQNLGTGKSEDTKVQVKLTTSNPNLSCPDADRVFDLGDIEPGDYREIEFYFFSTRRFTEEDIPLQLVMSDATGSNGKTVDLGLKMNVRTENIVDVSIARVETAKSEVKEIAGFQKSDIDDPPRRSKSSRPDGLAVIIGIEDYKYAPTATYAARDAEAFYNHAVQVLGIPERSIYFITNDGATVGEFMKLFDEGGWLSRRVTPQSDIFVFYSGHGAPDLATKSPYLIPYDIDPNYANRGYSASALYENLGKLEANSVTVMLDACFSGQDRESQMLLADARPVMMAVDSSGVPPEVTALVASSDEEISSGYPEQKHGVFSYFLMKGLSGSADEDKNGKLTVTELHEYVSRQVSRTAGFMDRSQTPQLLGKPEQSPLVSY